VFSHAFISRGQHATKEVEKAYSSIPENPFICHFSTQEVPGSNLAKPPMSLSTISSQTFGQFEHVALAWDCIVKYVEMEGIIDHAVLAR